VNYLKALVICLWLLFVTRGLFYCLALPLWEGFDEPYQFAVVQHVAFTGTLPNRSTPVSRQVAASLYLSPAPWMLREHHLPKQVMSQEQYWALPDDERRELRRKLLSLPSLWANEPSQPAIQNYEAQQAPLYYFMAAPILRGLQRATLPTQVIALRIFGMLLASLAIPLGYAVALRALGSVRAALMTTALAIVMPELFINVCRVSNEPLAMLLGTGLLLLVVRFVTSGRRLIYVPAIAIVFALALLSKAYFLALLPAIAFVLWWKLRQDHKAAHVLASTTLALAILVAVAGPWYWRAHKASGSWSGETNDAAAAHMSLFHLLAQVPHVNWRSGLSSIVGSHIWFGGWSFLRLPTWMYITVALLAAVPALGIVSYISKWLRSGLRPDPIIAVVSLYACFWAGLCYHVLVTYIHLGISASTGWYLYSLVFAETVLVVKGFEEVAGRAALRWALPSAVALLAVIDLYGLHALMLPYYAGQIAHAGERVYQVPFWTFRAGHIFARLSSTGPEWLTPGILQSAWLMYLAATASAMAMVWAVARADKRFRC
jgi:hypothetical protein